MSQLELIRVLQDAWTPWLTVLMAAITTLGGPVVYLFVAPVVFWLWSTRQGYRFLVLVLVAIWLNSVLKDGAAALVSDRGPLYATRPYLFAPEIRTCRSVPLFEAQALLARLCREEESFAFPSGHAQASIVFWGYLALVVRRRWVSILALVAVLLIGLSRVYLGQHWPSDVVGGWLIGAALVALGVWLFRRGQRHARSFNRVLLALVLCWAPLLVWFDPDPTFNRARALGLLVGGSLGYLVQMRWVPFSPHASWPRQVLKLLIGLGSVAALYLALSRLLPELSLTRFAVTVLVGVWALAGVPWLFTRLWPSAARGAAAGDLLVSAD
ncbi:phosphatase PAP2 family protein [Kallotenue papyrolyticum]|uniref:phosphatase PAP2 family protein n=1 Tax=Kallotenue papyrolyticum TaxID=1325125 RepID=UPI0004785503|nr:phosphatase PAP2 family protein [Kallotenue papyrolyticum]